MSETGWVFVNVYDAPYGRLIEGRHVHYARVQEVADAFRAEYPSIAEYVIVRESRPGADYPGDEPPGERVA